MAAQRRAHRSVVEAEGCGLHVLYHCGLNFKMHLACYETAPERGVPWDGPAETPHSIMAAPLGAALRIAATLAVEPAEGQQVRRLL
jgi:hypothetical protein